MGHQSNRPWRACRMVTLRKQSMTPHDITIPYGYCHCGCGRLAPIAARTINSRGQRKGFPIKFIYGHHPAKPRGESFLEATPFKINGVPCKLLPLTQGLHAVVLASRHAELSKHYWYASWNRCTKGFYAARKGVRSEGEAAVVSLHRFISGVAEGVDCDHADGNSLMNVDWNLRPANKRQNSSNRGKQFNNTSGYKGVSNSSSHGKYRARITAGRREKHIGTFNSKIKAAKAYDREALVVHGKFARINFPQEATR